MLDEVWSPSNFPSNIFYEIDVTFVFVSMFSVGCICVIMLDKMFDVFAQMTFRATFRILPLDVSSNISSDKEFEMLDQYWMHLRRPLGDKKTWPVTNWESSANFLHQCCYKRVLSIKTKSSNFKFWAKLKYNIIGFLPLWNFWPGSEKSAKIWRQKSHPFKILSLSL